jgi:hypothetical protein
MRYAYRRSERPIHEMAMNCDYNARGGSSNAEVRVPSGLRTDSAIRSGYTSRFCPEPIQLLFFMRAEASILLLVSSDGASDVAGECPATGSVFYIRLQAL